MEDPDIEQSIERIEAPSAASAINDVSANIQPADQALPTSLKEPSVLVSGSSCASVADSSWNAVRLLASRTWISNTLYLSRIFARDCVLPAVILTVGGLVMSAGRFFAYAQIHPTGMQLINIFAAMGIMMATGIVVLGSMIWGLALWMVRLSTFSHAFNQLDMAAVDFPGADSLRATLATSHAFILSRKKYLTRFYLLLLVVTIIPVCWWLGMATAKALSMAPADYSGVKFSLPSGLDTVLTIALILLGAYLMSISILSVVVSSNSKSNANVAAWDCIKVSFKEFIPLFIMVIVIVIMNTVIATPQIVLHPMQLLSLTDTQETLAGSLCSELWEGLTSVMLFTLTIAPFCELMRPRLK